ncbi:MAG: hypothetical protein VYC82_08760, partial [Verrucomicrobiota bacterium]|nr:hypothetical protein [Verrucomicrobiota bacterium]
RRWVGAFLFALIAGLFLWLGMRAPLMINPWETAGIIKGESLEASMVMLMAALLPVTMIGLFLCLVSVIVFAYVAFANEWRLIDIIRTYEE